MRVRMGSSGSSAASSFRCADARRKRLRWRPQGRSLRINLFQSGLINRFPMPPVHSNLSNLGQIRNENRAASRVK